MDFVEKAGKTVDEAITAALIELRVSSDQVDIQVLDEGSKGILGLFGRAAKVRVTLKKEQEPEIQFDTERESSAKAQSGKKAESIKKAETAEKTAPHEKLKKSKNAEKTAAGEKSAEAGKYADAGKSAAPAKDASLEAAIKEVKTTNLEPAVKDAKTTNPEPAVKGEKAANPEFAVKDARTANPETAVKGGKAANSESAVKDARTANPETAVKGGKAANSESAVKGEKAANSESAVKDTKTANPETVVKDELTADSVTIAKEEEAADLETVPREEAPQETQTEEQRGAMSADDNDIEKKAALFLMDVLDAMGIDSIVSTNVTEENVLEIDLEDSAEKSGMGMIIGKRGNTLDALQYLTTMVVNKNQTEHIRVKLDTENYRERRQKTLENLALNLAKKVKKTGHRVILEPMNPYERRIIHSTLQNDRQIETYSEGDEPNRRVVISLRRRHP